MLKKCNDIFVNKLNLLALAFWLLGNRREDIFIKE